MQTEEFDRSLFDSAEEAAQASAMLDAGRGYQSAHQPVGTHQAEITEAVLERSQSSGRLQIHYELTILVGPHKDTVIYKYDGLDTDVGTNITMQDLSRLGVDTAKVTIATLPAILITLKGKKVTIKAKQNKQYYNVNFVKILTTPVSASGTANLPAKKKF